MRILVLGGDGYLGWPTALHLSRAGYEVGVADNFARRGYDLEMGVDSLVPIASLHRRVERWEEVSGNQLDVFIGDLTEEEFVHDMVGQLPTRRHRPLCRAAQRPVLHGRSQACGLHAGEQRRRHVEPALRHRRARSVHPPRQVGHHGGVRHPQYRYRRGLHRDHAQGTHRHSALSQAAGELLPPVKSPRQPQHRLLLPGLGPPLDGPQPGDRLRPVDPGDHVAPGAGDPIRLRRRLRDRAQPVRDSGGGRRAVDGLRQGWSDEGLPGHP